MSKTAINAMILAAGFGKRMLPLSETIPKPLIKVYNKPLINYSLESLISIGVELVIVNAHYHANKISQHLELFSGQNPNIKTKLSLEPTLLETGGGVVKALPDLGDDRFFVLNSDSIILGKSGKPVLGRLFNEWDNHKMDALLLLSRLSHAVGYAGAGDFLLLKDGRPIRAAGAKNSLVFCGAQIFHPRLFKGPPKGPHSLNYYYDRAAELGRLFAIIHEGWWCHVGTPKGVIESEQILHDKGD